MDLLEMIKWIFIFVVAICGFIQMAKGFVKNVKASPIQWAKVFQALVMFGLSMGAGFIFKFAKFQNENCFFALMLGLVIAGWCQMLYEVVVQGKFLNGLLKKISGVDPETGESK